MQNLYEQWILNAAATNTNTNDFLNSSQNEKNNWLNSSLNLPPEQR